MKRGIVGEANNQRRSSQRARPCTSSRGPGQKTRDVRESPSCSFSRPPSRKVKPKAYLMGPSVAGPFLFSSFNCSFASARGIYCFLSMVFSSQQAGRRKVTLSYPPPPPMPTAYSCGYMIITIMTIMTIITSQRSPTFIEFNAATNTDALHHRS